MDDPDVDNLLKELEDLPCTSRSYPKTISGSVQASARGPSHKATSIVKAQGRQQQQQQQQQELIPTLAGVDALLQELQEHGPLHAQPCLQASSLNQDVCGRFKQQNRQKCSTIYLGGAHSSKGRCSPAQAQPCCCDSLRCTACDCKVVWYDDVRWAPDVDYMFFRNSYPTSSKLAAKQQHSHGSCAYCCQCSWAISSGTTQLAAVPAGEAGHSLRWVCSGHIL